MPAAPRFARREDGRDQRIEPLQRQYGGSIRRSRPSSGWPGGPAAAGITLSVPALRPRLLCGLCARRQRRRDSTRTTTDVRECTAMNRTLALSLAVAAACATLGAQQSGLTSDTIK